MLMPLLPLPSRERIGGGLGLRLLLEQLDNDPGWPTGIPLFDELDYPQKIAVLHDVAKALLMHREPAPRLTALNESAIAAVYEHMLTQIESEIRRRMLAVLKSDFKQDGLDLPDAPRVLS